MGLCFLPPNLFVFASEIKREIAFGMRKKGAPPTPPFVSPFLPAAIENGRRKCQAVGRNSAAAVDKASNFPHSSSSSIQGSYYVCTQFAKVGKYCTHTHKTCQCETSVHRKSNSKAIQVLYIEFFFYFYSSALSCKFPHTQHFRVIYVCSLATLLTPTSHPVRPFCFSLPLSGFGRRRELWPH